MRIGLLVLGLATALGCGDAPESPDSDPCLTSVYQRTTFWGGRTPCGDPVSGNPFEKCTSSLTWLLCMPEGIPRTADGVVACTVSERLPLGATCAGMVHLGRSPDPIDTFDGREVCTVNQALLEDGGVPGSPGFYYSDHPDDQGLCEHDSTLNGRIIFTDGAGPLVGSWLELECISEQAGDCRL